MKIVIAVNAFKNSISSKEANEIIYQTLKAKHPSYQYEVINISDGGEGFVDALATEIVEAEIIGPEGMEIASYFGIRDKKTALIQSSLANGIELVTASKTNANVMTSYGVGELILAALKENVDKIIIGLGGSATNDLGLGALTALGVEFYDENDNKIGILGEDIFNVSRIVNNIDKRLLTKEIIIATDVNNVLLGSDGASIVYGKQKGLNEEELKRYDKQFKKVSSLINKIVLKDETKTAGSGTAGGLGYALMSFLKVNVKSGFSLLAEELNLKERLKDADLLITGEGKIDEQTLSGKAPYSIAKMIKSISPEAKVIAYTGIKGEIKKNNIFDEIIVINENNKNIKENIKVGKTNLLKTVKNLKLANLFKTKG